MSEGNGNGNGKTPTVRDKAGPDGLTDKQRRFVEAFVGDAAGDHLAAYRAAGYSTIGDNESHEKTKAWSVLQRPAVQQAIAWYAARRGLDSENARLNLADVAQASMNNFVTVDEEGGTKLDFLRAAELGAIGQIKKYKETRNIVTVKPKDGDPETTETIVREIEVHNRLPAIELILKMNGLLNEKHQHQHTLVITDQPDPMIVDPLLNKLAVQYERHLASLSGRDGEPSN